MWSAAQAQTRLSLTEAIDLGLKNRYDVQAGQLNLALSENSIQKSRNAWLPELTLSGNVRYNTQLATTVLPAGFGGNSSEPQRITFGTKNNTFFSLDLTQPLYKPEARTDLKISENNRSLEQEKNSQQRTTIKIDIAEAYLNVLLKQVQQIIAEADEQRYRTYFGISEGKFKLGALLESDYLNARLDVSNSQISSQKARQNYRLAIDQLCYRLNIPIDTLLVLTDQIDPKQVTDYRLERTDAPSARTEIRQLTIQQAGYALQSQKVLDQMKPTVSLYGNYSTQFQYDHFNYFTNPWNNYNYLGLKLSVPISAQFTRRTDLNTYQLYARQTALNLKQTQADITYDVQKTETDFTNALLNLQSTQASLDVAQQVYQLKQEQYRLGTLLYSQILDTEKSIQTASQHYLEAVYSYLVAKLNYEKSVGKY